MRKNTARSAWLEQHLPTVVLMMLVLYVVVMFIFDPQTVHKDTASYLDMSSWRDGLFPVYCALFTWLFPAAWALRAAMFVQALLVVGAFWLLLMYLRKTFRLGTGFCIGATVFFMAAMILLSWAAAFDPFCPLWLETEGLGFVLTFLLCRFLLEAVLEVKYRPLIPAAVCTLLFTLLRGQGLYTLVLLFLSAAYVAIRKREKPLVYAGFVGGIVLIVVASSLLSRVYHWFGNGVFEGTAFGKVTVAAKMVYFSDPEDADLFDDPVVKQLYIDTQKIMTEQNNRLSATEGQLFIYRHMAYQFGYDDILWRTMRPLVREMLPEGTDENTVYREMDKLAGEMILPLLKAHPDRYLKITFWSAILGVIRADTLFRFNGSKLRMMACGISSAIPYLVGLWITVRALMRDKHSKAAWCMIFCTVMLLGNMAIPVLIHFPINRYTMYTTIPFLIAVAILVHEEILLRRGQKAAEQ